MKSPMNQSPKKNLLVTSKKMYVLLAIVFAFVSCNSQKKVVESSSASKATSMNQQNSAKLEYVATTRGFYQKITIEKQTVTISKDRNGVEKGETVKISDADMNELATALKSISLNDLATLKDPTQKRFYDGAAIAYLKVTDQEKEYQTVDFDHGFPPAAIETLITKITSFVKEE